MSERALKEAIEMVAALGWHALTGGEAGKGGSDSGLVEKCVAALSALQERGKGKLLPEEKVAISAAVSSLQLNYVKTFSENRLTELLSYLKTAALSGEWADVLFLSRSNRFFLNALRALEESVKEEKREEVRRTREEVEKKIGTVGGLEELARLLTFLGATAPSVARRALEEVLELCGDEMNEAERKEFDRALSVLKEKTGGENE